VPAPLPDYWHSSRKRQHVRIFRTALFKHMVRTSLLRLNSRANEDCGGSGVPGALQQRVSECRKGSLGLQSRFWGFRIIPRLLWVLITSGLQDAFSAHYFWFIVVGVRSIEPCQRGLQEFDLSVYL
jgi:hypothetical protein